MQLITNSPRRSSFPIGRILWLILAFVIGALVMGAIARRSNPSTPSATATEPKNTITVSAVEGEVDSKQGDGAWQTVSNTTVLEVGDTVRIVGTGHVALDLKGHGVIRLGDDTAVTLTEVNDQSVRVQHDRGELYLRLPTDTSSITVKTPAATYRVKGTSAVTYAGESVDGVAAITASATVTADGIDAQTINAGQSYYVVNKDPKALRTIVPLSDIMVVADEFLQWNAAQDRDQGVTDLGILGQAAPATGGSIQLTATTTDKGIVLAWKVDGTLDVSRGFKVLKSESRNPEFPGSSYQSEPQAGTRTHTWDVADGKTYHFRVCQFQADGNCGTYSNDVAVVAPNPS